METNSAAGAVTLLFADIENSTAGHQKHGHAFGEATREMQRIARAAAAEHRGRYVKHTGDGFLLDFVSSIDAILCARAIQATLLGEAWNADLPRLGVRIGIHSGEATMQDGEYTYPLSWRAQRVMDAANGGQVFVSETTYHLAGPRLTDFPELQCEDLGTFRLRDLLVEERLFSLKVQGLALNTRAPRVLLQNRHNLPLEKRPFLGREQEQEELLGKFRSQNSRLVTIVGMGGMGKTRLARQVAAQLTDTFPDGVWQVECYGLTDAQDLCLAIGRTLQIPEDTSSDQAVRNYLRDKRCLLLLDCFEGLVGAAPSIDALLSAAPHLSCLVTSRVVLRLERELAYILPPLPTPQQGALPANSSMALFSNAAQYVDPKFETTEQNRTLVAEICDSLEGIPLSINLAAGWLRYMSLSELLETVRARRQDVLSDGMLDAAAHRDMAQVVDRSVLLLRPEERRLLRMLSIFVGGFYFEDACAVCLPNPSAPRDRATLRQRIARLLDNSLLNGNEEMNRTRYKIYDTVREYLRDMNDADPDQEDLAACRDRHCSHYGELALQMKQSFAAHRYKEANDSLFRDLGNLRAAIQYSIAMAQHDRLIGFTEALARAYYEAALWQDLQTLREATEQVARQQQRIDVIILLLGISGSQAMRRGQTAEARRLWQEQVELCIEIGDLQRAASTLFDLANMDCEADAHEEARQRLARATALVQTDEYRAAAHTLLAVMALKEGDLPLTRQLVNQALQWRAAIPNVDIRIFVHVRLGNICRQLDETACAESLLLSAVGAATEGSRSFSLSWALLSLARLEEQTGRFEEAAHAYTGAFRVLSDTEPPRRQRALEALEAFRRSQESTVQTLLDTLFELPGQEVVTRLLSLCEEASEKEKREWQIRTT